MTTSEFSAVVIGAGIVGTCTALELARRGKSVLLLDRREPGRETSYGNLGVVAVGSATPLNNPTLWSLMPQLLRNRSAFFRYDPFYVMRNPGWFLAFLVEAREGSSQRRGGDWCDLLGRGRTRHRALLVEAGEEHRLRRDGWLHLRRGNSIGKKLDFANDIMERAGIDFETLDHNRIAELEPVLEGHFGSGVWIKDADTVDDPGAVVEAYAGLLARQGGRFRQSGARGIEETPTGWIVHAEDGAAIHTTDVVVSLGPWSKSFLKPNGIRMPLAHERGSHREYIIPSGEPALTRPIYDVDGSYALSPMAGRYRITTGVYMADHNSPMEPFQLDAVEPLARKILAIGPRTNTPDWFGARPTFPDFLPAIGRTARQGLWLATGHQHLGFSTGPSTGEILAQMMCGEQTSVDASPFAPDRYGI